MLGCVIVIVGAVVSTTTAVVDSFAVFLFVAQSATLFAFIVNFTFPFLFAIHSYTSVNVLLPVVPPAVTLFIFTSQSVAIVNDHDVKLVVLTHAPVSVHVTTILPVTHAPIGVLLGFHHVHAGATLSIFSTFADNLYVVFPAASTAL